MTYTEFPKAKILTAITKAADDRSYHPVREYLDGLPEWDGIPRVDTLLIDYLARMIRNMYGPSPERPVCGGAPGEYPGVIDTVLVLCGAGNRKKHTDIPSGRTVVL